MNRPVLGLPSLWRDRRGVSALEFALIAPVMIAFYFGMSEFAQAFMAQKRMAHATSVVADLAAQDDALDGAEIADIFAAGQAVMQPYSTARLSLRLSSITVNSSGTANVDWSRGSGMAARSEGSTMTLPDGIVTNGESVIVAESTYDFESPVGAFLPGLTRFNRTYYLRPRIVAQVAAI